MESCDQEMLACGFKDTLACQPNSSVAHPMSAETINKAVSQVAEEATSLGRTQPRSR